MRRSTRLWLAASLACGGAVASSDRVRAGDPDADAVIGWAHDLEDPSFGVRRRAERALYLEGSSILSRLAAGADGVDDEIAAFERALASCDAVATPASAVAVQRISARLDESATDGQVRRFPRLLRARLSRLLPAIVVDELEAEARDEARIDDRAVRGLFPEARPILVEAVETSSDPRALAGALALLCAEDGRGPDDADLAIVGAAYAHDPSRFDGIARYGSVVGAAPVAALALALAWTGRTDALRALVARGDLATDSLRTWLEPRLLRRGAGDLTAGSYLQRYEEGTASAADELEAGRRAAAAGIPWLPRLLARRALFLEPASAEARALLASSSAAVGLRTPERRDAVPGADPAPGAQPTTPGESDDADAVAIDDALRAGRLSQRLLHRIEAGRRPGGDLVAVAIGGGRLVHATDGARLRVVDAESGEELYTFRSGSRAGAAALALRGDDLAEVTADGSLLLWSLGAADATQAFAARGAWRCVLATADGFLVGGDGLRLARATRTGLVRVESARVDGAAPSALHPLRDGVLVVSGTSARRIDLRSGRSTPVALPDGVTAIATSGDAVVVASGDGLVRVDPDGTATVVEEARDEGPVVGLAVDAAGTTAYLQTPGEVRAVSTADGALRWSEPLEGSGAPVVGDGLVAVRAGGGRVPRAGARAERTIYVLRGSDVRLEALRRRDHAQVVSLATAAAAEGRPGVAVALADPFHAWLSERERAAIDEAVDAASPAPRPERPR